MALDVKPFARRPYAYYVPQTVSDINNADRRFTRVKVIDILLDPFSEIPITCILPHDCMTAHALAVCDAMLMLVTQRVGRLTAPG